MKHRNIPISMICTNTIDGQITPIRFRIQHKDGSKVQYNVLETKRVENSRQSGVKTIFFYSVININNKDYDVVFRFNQDTCKWELARI